MGVDEDDEDEGNKICQMLVKSLKNNNNDGIGGCWCTIRHILNTNRGGRRALFCSSDNNNNAILPLATWSYILARVANSSASINNNDDDDDASSSLYYNRPNHEEHVKEDKEDP